MIQVSILSDKPALGRAAAASGAAAIRKAIADRGKANIVVATGASQFETMAALVADDTIDWAQVTAFHLDEYIGLGDTHPASFRLYLRTRFTSQLPTLGRFRFVDGDAADLDAELADLEADLAAHPIDVMFAGIGENAHLAFNDPPADFAARESFRVVTLDERCRGQQFGEGWFESLDAVPKIAVSMTVPQMMKSAALVLAVPERRKAEAVRATLEGPITPQVPASIMQQHADCQLFLDPDSASLLDSKGLRQGA